MFILEIKENLRQIEKIDNEGKPLFHSRTTAKDMRAWIQGQINKCSKYGNSEYEFFFREILNAYEYFHPALENLKLEIEIVGGWKGVGDTRVYMGFDNDIRILIPLKDKLTGIVKKNPKTIYKEDINNMIKIIKEMSIGQVCSCYQIAEKMGLDWREDIWKNRTKVYFAKYYYPLKFLEAMRIIQYGDGTIRRLL